MKINDVIPAFFNPLLLIVWFFVWGVCPWDTAPVAQAEGRPGPHSEATHHAAKGAEHSCSGSISFTQSKADSDLFLNQSGPIEARVAPPERPARSGSSLYFFESIFLPRLLTAYYQLYSVYRI